MKKTQLKITIEQKQAWRISQSGNEDLPEGWQTEEPALLKDADNTETSPRRAQSQGWVLKVLSVLVRGVNYALRLIARIKNGNK